MVVVFLTTSKVFSSERLARSLSTTYIQGKLYNKLLGYCFAVSPTASVGEGLFICVGSEFVV